jgi:peptidoglycan/LPS O-acetylase OafA/YrhL
MSYGRFAVIIFIALSGFSLGLGLARSGWRFKSIATYAHRRPGASCRPPGPSSYSACM